MSLDSFPIPTPYPAKNIPSNRTSSEFSFSGCLASHSLIQDCDSKISQTRTQVLETIRNYFPLTALFNPKIKIDLGVFIRDQLFIQRIAEFITPLIKNKNINSELVANHFENTPLLTEIQSLFKQNPLSYLTALFEACSDVLNKKSFSQIVLKSAIEGRVYTLKNALVAQLSPDTMRTNQLQCNITPKNLSAIKEEGALFIRECLYLHTLNNSQSARSFKESLASTAEQLIPFVRTITKEYLREHGKECSDNPLTFRNPSGYNHQGLTAATIMDVCLQVLGYTTQIMQRSDLEPRVTLATAHSIVKVIAPDMSKYLVDPCYLQFHKDICMDETLLPTVPVLVLGEEEVDAYIENALMAHWKACAECVAKELGNQKSGALIGGPVCRRLSEQRQILAFIAERLECILGVQPVHLERWVKNALQRVWSLPTYTPILSNKAFQDIFADNTSESKTYGQVKAMGLGPLTRYLPTEEVKIRLRRLLHNPELLNKNSFEALSLIAQLQSRDRIEFKDFLDINPNVMGLSEVLNAYFRSLKKIVNPESKDLNVIYGCSGVDCTTVMLATDAKEFIFVDLSSFSYEKFEKELQNFSHPAYARILLHTLTQSDDFLVKQRTNGGAVSHYTQGKHQLMNFESKLLFNLWDNGVDLSKIILSSEQQGSVVRLEFPWQYHGASEPRNRTIILINTDLTKPHTYPPILKEKLEQGINIFYMKAGFLVPGHYPDFLPFIAQAIEEDGWIMTADKTFTMEDANPEPCLEQNGLKFTLQGNKEKKLIEELMTPPFDPLCTIPSLEYFSTEQRPSRTPGSDLSYWAILNLRKKLG